jgi:hypothetical protein
MCIACIISFCCSPYFICQQGDNNHKCYAAMLPLLLLCPILAPTIYYTLNSLQEKKGKLKTKPKSCCDECRGARKEKNGERCIVSTSLNITLTTIWQERESRLTSGSVKCFEFRRGFCSTFHAPAHGQRAVSLFISSRVHHTHTKKHKF